MWRVGTSRSEAALVIALAFLRMRWLRQRIDAVGSLDAGPLTADALLVLLILAMMLMLGVFGLHVGQ